MLRFDNWKRQAETLGPPSGGSFYKPKGKKHNPLVVGFINLKVKNTTLWW